MNKQPAGQTGKKAIEEQQKAYFYNIQTTNALTSSLKKHAFYN